MNTCVDWENIARILLQAIDETRSCSEDEMKKDLVSRGISSEVLDHLSVGV